MIDRYLFPTIFREDEDETDLTYQVFTDDGQ